MQLCLPCPMRLFPREAVPQYAPNLLFVWELRQTFARRQLQKVITFCDEIQVCSWYLLALKAASWSALTAAQFFPAVPFVRRVTGASRLLGRGWLGDAAPSSTAGCKEKKGNPTGYVCLAFIFRVLRATSHLIDWVAKIVCFHVRAVLLPCLTAAGAHGWAGKPGTCPGNGMFPSPWAQGSQCLEFQPAPGSIPPLPKAQGMLS